MGVIVMTDRNVFHLFTDAQLKQTPEHPSGKYGPTAVGIVLLDSAGATVYENALFLKDQTNNRGELYGVKMGVAAAHAVLPVPARSKLIVHTDSRVAYRGLVADELKDHRLVKIRDAVRIVLLGFGAHGFALEPRDSKGIRRAEHLARKELGRKLGLKLTRRGSKGRRHRAKEKPLDPYKGELKA